MQHSRRLFELAVFRKLYRRMLRKRLLRRSSYDYKHDDNDESFRAAGENLHQRRRVQRVWPKLGMQYPSR